MISLRKILYGVSIESTLGSMDRKINNISFNSQNIINDSLFVSIKGEKYDGNKFIEDSIGKGANVVICEGYPLKINSKITYIKVLNSKKALGIISNNFYKNPSNEIKLIGVTGTNGKTTCATLLYDLFNSLGFNAGLISTVEIKFLNFKEVTKNTTPDSIKISSCLKRMVDSGIQYCFMEVSSHGIFQNRIYGLNFKGGVFLNLSHDHLDYHKSFKNYRDVKKTFFDSLPKNAFALTNLDDKNGKFMLQNTNAKKKSFGIKAYADFNCKVLEVGFSGMLLNIDNREVWTQIIGNHNAYNLLAVYSVAILLKQESIDVLSHLSKLKNVIGRFQTIQTSKKRYVIIDYAHTPDALKNILRSINEIRTKNERLITIIGCGGNRDKKKRPVMGKIACILSDIVIFTSDNPRDENPKDIINSMIEGVPLDCSSKVLKIVDRKNAIKKGCEMLGAKDILLIAGKGHEKYQEIKGKTNEFNEYKIVREIISKIE